MHRLSSAPGRPSLATEPLTFELLDDLLLAHERGRATGIRAVPGPSLGSVVELMRFAEEHGDQIAYLPTEETDAIRRCLRTRRPVYLNGESTGFIAARREAYKDSDTWWDAFQLAMHKANIASGFPRAFSRGLVGALGEMQGNVHDHSNAVDTGVIAYRVTSDSVEWVVADRGIGVLKGLQDGAYPSLRDAGDALKIALADGGSRFGSRTGRGYGFRELFKALATRQGTLRFRSDDQLLTIAGVSPSLSRARLQQRARVPGFSVTVVCAKPLQLNGG